MLESKRWNESQFDWKQTIMRFRKYTSKTDDDIFKASKGSNEVDTVSGSDTRLLPGKLK
jgi:hypothetical protein